MHHSAEAPRQRAAGGHADLVILKAAIAIRADLQHGGNLQVMRDFFGFLGFFRVPTF